MDVDEAREYVGKRLLRAVGECKDFGGSEGRAEAVQWAQVLIALGPPPTTLVWEPRGEPVRGEGEFTLCSVDDLVGFVQVAVDSAVIDAAMPPGSSTVTVMTDASIAAVATRAALQYVVENGLVVPCDRETVPALLPLRVGQDVDERGARRPWNRAR